MSDNPGPELSASSPADPDHTRSAKASGRKRKRVSVACRSCRARKSRCNGGQPCSSCEDMETECLYEHLPSRQATASGPRPSGLLDANARLERRLQAIEEKLTAMDAERCSGGQSTISPTAQEVRQLQTPTDLGGGQGQHDEVDGMGSVPLKDGADEDEYFGASSNVAFLRFIVKSVGHLVDAVPDTSRSTMDVSTANPLSEDGQKGNANPLTLPPQEQADALLRLYFSTVNLFMPCIHEPSFRETYLEMQRSGLGSVRRSWLGILHVILAIATNVMSPTSPTHERAAQSNLYFDRAVELVRPAIFGRLSLETVQLFLLVETYLEGTSSSSLTWTFHSLTVKGAYQLGLHTVGGKMELPDLEQEVRRRLWYCCVINDRLLSVSYGRPPLIQLSHVRLGASLHLPFSNVSSTTTASSLGFFNALISLTHIMGAGLDRLYGQNLGIEPPPPMSETLDRIFGLCWRLAQWQDNLPPNLQIINSTTEVLEDVPLTVGATRLRVLLSLRYLGSRTLIIRPVLSQFLEMGDMTASHDHRSEWLFSSGAVLLVDLVRTCREVFQISMSILRGHKNDQNLLGAWWFSCYYTFNAALAILGVLLVKRVPAYSGEFGMIESTELRSLLDMAMDILRGLDQGNITLLKCQETLQKLLLAVEYDCNLTKFTPQSLTLSPSSAWTWQLMDPGFFTSEASMSLAIGAFDPEGDSHLPTTVGQWVDTSGISRPSD
ncbi:fungal-specific transcription factor domain-containing protein [Aspergillus pseudoustus]|uniref:Fungal-specific transcription factor domain-containing protein n=1 Tax=Aspergillus pseudoustus TaxID=1810923 RepID=A0ABR4IJZ4_9EURO